MNQMNNNGRGCGKFSPDELLLFAYRESEDRELGSHLKDCAECAAYVDEVRAVSKLVKMVPPESAGERPVKAVMNFARRGQRSETGLISKVKDVLTGGSFPVWAPVAAAAALAVVLALYWPSEENGGKAESGMPLYLTSLNSDLTELERSVESQAGDLGVTEEPDPLSLFMGDGASADDANTAADLVSEGISEIELAMNEIEYSMGLADSETYEGSNEQEDGYREADYDEFEIPLVPEIINGATF